MEEFLIFLEENIELAESVFNEYYKEQAAIEGEELLDMDMYDNITADDDPVEIYETYAHVSGHSAHYYGAIGVIRELGIQSGFSIDEEDEELQWEVLVMLDKEI